MGGSAQEAHSPRAHCTLRPHATEYHTYPDRMYVLRSAWQTAVWLQCCLQLGVLACPPEVCHVQPVASVGPASGLTMILCSV